MRPRVFISHAWHREELYLSLVQVFNEIARGKWTNLSIPRSQGLQLLSRGEKALLEEIELQQQLRSSLRLLAGRSFRSTNTTTNETAFS